MDKKKSLALAIFALVWFVVGTVCGFFIGKGVYDQPLQESVSRDTVTLTDTIVKYLPKPVKTEKVRTEYKFLPVVHTDTFVKADVITLHDSVLVEIPITSKHYHGENYDAYVSGFEVNIDSIKTYNKTEYVTETITLTKPTKRKPWGIGFTGGYGYDFNAKTASPYIGVGISYDIISF